MEMSKPRSAMHPDGTRIPLITPCDDFVRAGKFASWGDFANIIDGFEEPINDFVSSQTQHPIKLVDDEDSKAHNLQIPGDDVQVATTALDTIQQTMPPPPTATANHGYVNPSPFEYVYRINNPSQGSMKCSMPPPCPSSIPEACCPPERFPCSSMASAVHNYDHSTAQDHQQPHSHSQHAQHFPVSVSQEPTHNNTASPMFIPAPQQHHQQPFLQNPTDPSFAVPSSNGRAKKRRIRNFQEDQLAAASAEHPTSPLTNPLNNINVNGSNMSMSMNIPSQPFHHMPQQPQPQPQPQPQQSHMHHHHQQQQPTPQPLVIPTSPNTIPQLSTSCPPTRLKYPSIPTTGNNSLESHQIPPSLIQTPKPNNPAPPTQQQQPPPQLPQHTQPHPTTTATFSIVKLEPQQNEQQQNSTHLTNSSSTTATDIGLLLGASSSATHEALQCRGMNRKKRTRCRNAALMEYVGPRPVYCAEHIGQDPNALYHKCDFVLVSDTTKRCKEIVFKEFKHCYKHFNEWLQSEFVGTDAIPKTKAALLLASNLASQLEMEAMQSKVSDPELYQRKSKLLPKYQSMVQSLQGHLYSLQHSSSMSSSSLQQPQHQMHRHNSVAHTTAAATTTTVSSPPLPKRAKKNTRTSSATEAIMAPTPAAPRAQQQQHSVTNISAHHHNNNSNNMVSPLTTRPTYLSTSVNDFDDDDLDLHAHDHHHHHNNDNDDNDSGEGYDQDCLGDSFEHGVDHNINTTNSNNTSNDFAMEDTNRSVQHANGKVVSDELQMFPSSASSSSLFQAIAGSSEFDFSDPHENSIFCSL